MDQESTKPGPIGGTKGSWRDRLGINKELPKISEEFKQTPPKAASSDHPESADDRAPPPPRPGTPVSKPAPMAPRQPAGDLGDRIRQQREAAERMAEKRVAEAKERAVQQPRPGMPATGGGAPPPGQRPKFTFADEEFRQAQQEPREPQQSPPPRQWTQAPHPANSTRPVFTADKAHDRPQSAGDPRPRALMPPRNPPPAGAGSYRAPAPPRGRPGNSPPPSYPPQQSARQDRQYQGRPQRPPQQGSHDPYRREMPPPPPHEGGFGEDDAYGRHQPPHETPRPRSPDFRGAHSRELAHVQDGDDGLFEDEQNYSQQPPPRRRAGPQEYTQAYREFESAEEEPARRRQTGPFILLGALLTAGVIAAGLVYFYFYQGNNGAQSQAEVPVVAEPEQPVKTEPQADSNAESNAEDAVSVPSQTSTANAPEAAAPASAQKKQIYDRILGETTLEEREQIAPSEEQPVAPDGPSQGFDADPLPLPLPPPPDGGAGDQGSLPAPGDVQTSALQTKSAPSSDLSAQASPASATVESDASDDSGEPLPVPGAQEDVQPAESASAAESTEPATAEPEPQAIAAKPKADNALAVTPQPTPPPAPSTKTANAELSPDVQTGTGPVQIAQIPAGESVQSGGVAPSFNTASLPDVTTETTAAKRTTRGRAGDRIVINPNRNFNKSKAGQTAMVEPALMTETIAQGGEQADPQPSAPVVEPQPVVESAGEPVLQQQAALPPPAPVEASPATQPQAQLSGFIIQLASHKTEADAQADYNRLVLQHGAVLGNLKYNIQQTKLNTGAVFYQLHLGSFASRQAAKDMCTSLLATGERDCLVKSR